VISYHSKDFTLMMWVVISNGVEGRDMKSMRLRKSSELNS